MWQYVPSATPGRLWLFQVKGRRWGRFDSVREVTTSGRTTLRSRHGPPAGGVVGATLDGIVMEGPGGIRVWDPQTGRLVLRQPDGFVVATAGRRVAWCRGDCRTVRVSAPGEQVELRLPAGTEGGALSPDGARLALAVSSHRLVVADLATRRVRALGGVRLGGYAALAWDPSGRRLFAGAAGGRVVAVRPDGGRPATVARLQGKIMQLSAG
jgi:hypothetical protein